MAIREVRACGLDYLALATELLHRARLADPEAGLCDLEAADLQWRWPHASELGHSRASLLAR